MKTKATRGASMNTSTTTGCPRLHPHPLRRAPRGRARARRCLLCPLSRRQRLGERSQSRPSHLRQCLRCRPLD
eukprot:1230012-Prymnesium_polylepis.1